MSSGTEVHNYTARLSQTVIAQPMDSLADTVEFLSEGTPIFLWNSEQTVEPPIAAQRLVGRKPWTVFSRDESDLANKVAVLEEDVAVLKENVAVLEADTLLCAQMFLRNAASEVVQFALQNNYPRPATTTYFSVIALNGSAKLSTFVASLNQGQALPVPTNETVLARMLDDVIQRRNGTIHHVNRQILEERAVSPARGLLLRHLS